VPIEQHQHQEFLGKIADDEKSPTFPIKANLEFLGQSADDEKSLAFSKNV
jgi:hypothetical protein